jgi:hypothetical protein
MEREREKREVKERDRGVFDILKCVSRMKFQLDIVDQVFEISQYFPGFELN